MIEFADYPLNQYRREKYGRWWRIKSFFMIESPSAYTRWVVEKRQLKARLHPSCLCVIVPEVGIL